MTASRTSVSATCLRRRPRTAATSPSCTGVEGRMCGRPTRDELLLYAGARPGCMRPRSNMQNLTACRTQVAEILRTLIKRGDVRGASKFRRPSQVLSATGRAHHRLSTAGGRRDELLPHRGVAARRAPSGGVRGSPSVPDDRSFSSTCRLRRGYNGRTLSGDGISIARVHSAAALGRGRVG